MPPAKQAARMKLIVTTVSTLMSSCKGSLPSKEVAKARGTMLIISRIRRVSLCEDKSTRKTFRSAKASETSKAPTIQSTSSPVCSQTKPTKMKASAKEQMLLLRYLRTTRRQAHTSGTYEAQPSLKVASRTTRLKSWGQPKKTLIRVARTMTTTMKTLHRRAKWTRKATVSTASDRLTNRQASRRY